jgi:DNA-binding CsgD family transcriptional regulator
MLGEDLLVSLFERGGERYALVTFTRDGASLGYPGLTAAEQQIARDWSAGITAREIAHRRSVSVHTVNNQVRAIYDKLGVHSRAELARTMSSR